MRRNRSRRRLRRNRLILLAVALFVSGVALALSFVGRGADGHQLPTTGATAADTMEMSQPGSLSPRASSPGSAGPGPLRHVRGRVIAIDPGHNGLNWRHGTQINRQVNAGTLWKACDTTGTQTNDGYTESAYNLDVSRRLAAILRRAGARVVLTRRNDAGWGPCITERAAIGNRADADVAISIHADGGPASGHGFHVISPPSIQGLTDDIARDSRRLAVVLRRAYLTTGMPEANYVGLGGLDVRSDLGGLNLSNVPKVLFETGNMRNEEDAVLLKSAAFRQRAAAAMASGIGTFLARSR